MKSGVGQGYSPVAKLLHWFVAVVVIIMLSVTFFFDELSNHNRSTAFMLHKSFGLTVLVLMIVRFIWIHITGKPKLPDSIPGWQKFMSRFVQYSLYLLLIAMPITGWVLSVAANKAPVYFGMFQVPLPGIEPNKALAGLMSETHQILAWVIIAFVSLHVAAALKHHFIDKDNVLERMLPGKQR